MPGDAGADRFELDRFERRESRISAQLTQLYLSGRFIGPNAEALANNAVLVVLRAGEVLARVAARPGSAKLTHVGQAVGWSASFSVRRSLLADPTRVAFGIGLDGSSFLRLPTARGLWDPRFAGSAPAPELNDETDGRVARPHQSRHRRAPRVRVDGRPMRFVRALPEGFYVVVVCALVAAGAAAAGLALAPNTHQARALIDVTPVSAQNPDFSGVPILRSTGDPTPALQSGLGLVSRSAVAQLTATRMGPNWSEQRVADDVHPTLDAASNLIEVTASGDSPPTAVRLANVYAGSALALRKEELQPSLRAALDRARAEALSLGRARTPASIAAGHRLAVLTAMQGYGDPTMQLARRAVALPSRGPTHQLAILILALGAGALLGLCSTWLIQRRGLPALSDERRIRRLTGLPVLARLPLKSDSHGRRMAPVTHEVRGLLTLLETDAERPATIAVVSPSPGDGKTTVATALATYLANRGEMVTLLDLDWRAGDAYTRVGVAPVRQAGMLLPSPMASTLSVARVRRGAETEETHEAIKQAQLLADRVVIDTPALGVTRDALVAAARAETVLMVVTLGHTPEPALVEAHNALLRAHANPAGVVVFVPRRRFRPRKP